ncbi:hypothetical protein VIGAN_01439200 [Vigna angularis var. angularis]|uniref:Uncharacterized protein n=1 Tax=Vigna angularis var. angularis TaxID=157739 RepID=A0A0S3R751_PHAAN|nr:hypothetical protein VIGAN_01439200 [Vigna angularis var. angularis]
MYVRLPLSVFQMDVLKTLNVAPTQLHPNSWGYIQAFAHHQLVALLLQLEADLLHVPQSFGCNCVGATFRVFNTSI